MFSYLSSSKVEIKCRNFKFNGNYILETWIYIVFFKENLFTKRLLCGNNKIGTFLYERLPNSFSYGTCRSYRLST